MDFNDYRAKITIAEMAEYLGYTKISSPNARYLEYALGSRQMLEDKIIIYPNGKAYFSCKGDINDKGDLTKFVLYRLNRFSNCTQTGYKGVNEVLSKYLGNDLKTTAPTRIDTIQPQKVIFDINKYSPRPLTETTTNYLNAKRHLSKKTIEDFSSRLLVYSVGTKDNVGFPFRKPGQMEITNFEMRNYDPVQNVNFKGFCLGGDKSNSCWIANFVPFDKVTEIYLFESALDAMSFYEINHFNKNTTCAFISIGGNITQSQIISIKSVFPNVKWNCCFDNDGAGNGFDVATAYYLKGEDCKTFLRTIPGDNFKTIFISFSNGQTQSWKEEEFSSCHYLSSMKMENIINIIKTPKCKDWNDLLRYYKLFDCNLGVGMKFIPAIEDTMSQLHLRGYHLLADMFQTKGQELIQSLVQRSTYNLSAPLAETNAYRLMVDCNIFMGIDTMVPIPNNLYIFDKTTQKTIPASTINEYLKKECINIFRDLNANDFKNLLEKQVLTYTKGNVERNFERVISPTGWGLKECTPIKKKDIDLGLEI
jgi:hypothetical protein